MFLHEFPDIHWLKAQIKTGFENQLSWDGRKLKQPGWPSVILNAKANKVHRENITGPLSFFTNISGNSLVNAGKKELSVNENTFLISNSKQEYSLHIPLQAKTFNIHVGDKLASEVWYYATHSSKYLLDSPEEVFTTIEFHNRVHWRDDYFNALIGKLAHYESETEEQELIGELLLRLADTEIKHQQSANQLKVAKVATREEIIRRLYLAADYIYSNFNKDVSLGLLSRISCLSKFHLVRLFKEYFQETPHQFITRIRLEKSVCHLKSSDFGIKEISEKVGIKNASSFSRLFRHHFGVYPSQYKV